MQEESAGEAGPAAAGGESWRPPYGVVRRDVPEGPGVRTDHGIVRNLEYLWSLPIKEFEKYRGEWLGVAGGGIVAHGRNPERVLKEGREAGKGEVYIEYIYASPEEVPFSYMLDDIQ